MEFMVNLWLVSKEYKLQQIGIPICVILGIQFRDHNIQEEISADQAE